MHADLAAEQQRKIAEFRHDIDSHKIAELPLEYDQQVLQQLTSAVQQTGILLVGEMHGAAENPDAIYTLMKKLGIRELALEWQPSMKESVVEFLSSGSLDPQKFPMHFPNTLPDGRITAGHFALFKRLQGEQALDNLVCFDMYRYEGDPNIRDLTMAEKIRDGRTPGKPLLVVAGNLHTRRESFTLPEGYLGAGETMAPMGYHLTQTIPGIPVIEIEYLGGTYFNCGERAHGTNAPPGKPRLFLKDGVFKFQVFNSTSANVPHFGADLADMNP